MNRSVMTVFAALLFALPILSDQTVRVELKAGKLVANPSPAIVFVDSKLTIEFDQTVLCDYYSPKNLNIGDCTYKEMRVGQKPHFQFSDQSSFGNDKVTPIDIPFDVASTPDWLPFAAAVAAFGMFVLSVCQMFFLGGREELHKAFSSAQAARDTYITRELERIRQSAAGLGQDPSSSYAVKSSREETQQSPISDDMDSFVASVQGWMAQTSFSNKSLKDALARVKDTRARLKSDNSSAAQQRFEADSEAILKIILRQSDTDTDPVPFRRRDIQNLLRQMLDSAGFKLISPSPDAPVNDSTSMVKGTEKLEYGAHGKGTVAKVLVRGLQKGGEIVQKAEVSVWEYYG